MSSMKTSSIQTKECIARISHNNDHNSQNCFIMWINVDFNRQLNYVCSKGIDDIESPSDDVSTFLQQRAHVWGELRICSTATGKICFDYNQFLVISDHDDDNNVLLLLMIMMKTPAPMTMATMMTMAKKMAILLLLMVVGMMMMRRRMMIKNNMIMMILFLTGQTTLHWNFIVMNYCDRIAYQFNGYYFRGSTRHAAVLAGHIEANEIPLSPVYDNEVDYRRCQSPVDTRNWERY